MIQIVEYNQDDGKILKLYAGDFEAAIATAKDQDTFRIWLFRGIGFVMMFFGLFLFLNPISILLRLIPVAGGIAGLVLFFVSFVAALILSVITIIISIIFP